MPVIISAVISTRRIEEFLNLPEVPSKNIGIQTIARILCRSDTHSDLIEDQQSLGGDQSGDESVHNSTLNRSKAFISKDPWVLTIGKLKIKGRTEEILSFDIRIPKCENFRNYALKIAIFNVIYRFRFLSCDNWTKWKWKIHLLIDHFRRDSCSWRNSMGQVRKPVDLHLLGLTFPTSFQVCHNIFRPPNSMADQCDNP